MFRKSPASAVRILKITRSFGQPVEYLKTARKVAGKYPDNDEVLNHLIVALSENEEWDEAADVASRAAELTVDPVVLVACAWSLITVGRAEEARAAASKALDSRSLEAYVRTEAVCLRGSANALLGNMERAEPDLREAVARDDQRPTYIFHLAKFLVVNDRRDEALELVALARRVADDAERAGLLNELAEMGLASG